jgi:plastocyanin
VEIAARDFSFTPHTVEFPVDVPAHLTFTNEDMAPHTLTIYWDPGFTEPLLAGVRNIPGGDSRNMSVQIPHAETLYFRCEIHPEMQND